VDETIMQRDHEIQSELAIPDLQRRLAMLGYQLGDEAGKGLFGEKTAAAVTLFKQSTGLGNDDTLDQTTWTALKDASMTMGDRPLYLHIPHFRGRDVGELQGALSSMGFACAVDTNFGTETEQALREFQDDMGLRSTGILDDKSLAAIFRLRHLWEGKRGLFLEDRPPIIARSMEVLEACSVCVFGIDESTRIIANRVANLARATTVESGVLSPSALGTEPRKGMLLVGLELGKGKKVGENKKEVGKKAGSRKVESNKEEGKKEGKKKEGSRKEKAAPESADTPRVYLDDNKDLLPELKAALATARAGENRITLVIDAVAGERDDSVLQSQEIAARILDALCLVL